MFIIKGTPLEASFYGFYKDKHRKFGAIMTEILPHLDIENNSTHNARLMLIYFNSISETV